ncbi:AzlD domain-containing protein [Atopobiaceae bacterium 24-176]
MDLSLFWPLYGLILATMLVCRCVPLFALGSRELPPRATAALETIPVAAFSALVANDLFQPEAWSRGPAAVVAPLASAAVVAVCAWRTRSLALCAAVGVAAYLVLSTAVSVFGV